MKSKKKQNKKKTRVCHRSNTEYNMKQVCITHPDPVIRSSLTFQQLKMKPCTFISFSLNKLLLLLLSLLKSECVYNLFGTTIWMLIKI